ncbi:MAG: pyruvate, phosphate dikinase [Aigarchaeota archaeon]|nr:pyruvate, phosphate dikinase [Aigarchaeota archaeon]MCX8192389.1 pyruvate, phosphate dikinase [Nitrososphaeria archaeon]MDW7986493.1 pyruvate, phosphate dikinase [Nitrososphaerota archaeon]
MSERNARVLLFEEAVGMTKFELGGKGYGLVEMTRIGLPVPPGINIPTYVCREFYATNKLPDGLLDEVREKLRIIEERVGRWFGSTRRPLLVSVRSGAPYSMPGMMDTILNLGLNDEIVKALAEESKDERFAYDSYRRLIQMFGKIVMGVKDEKFSEIIEEHKNKLGVKHDVEIPPDEWKKIIEEFKELIKRETGREFPQDPWEQLRMAIEAVFKSWNNPRAIVYRKTYNIPEDLYTAVNIQMMVFGNLGPNSGTGVGFTRNPSTGEKKLYGEYLLNAQGEDVVAGVRTPKPLEELKNDLPEVYEELLKVSKILEEHFKEMQDFEFTIQEGKLYLLQTRNGKRTAQAGVKIAVDMVNEGLISKEEAIARIDPSDLNQLLHPRIDPNVKAKPIAKGLNASPGAATGKVVFTADEAAELGAKGEKVILVRPETKPEDIHGMISAQGILTSRGGMTSHAAVVARGMGKPAVVGAEMIKIDLDRELFTVNGISVKKFDIITIDGTEGHVYLGALPTIEPELSGELKTLLSWTDEFRRLGVRANAETPSAARKAREFGAEGIGLARTERMFNAPDRLPIVYELIFAETEDERWNAVKKLLPMFKSDFKEIFREMAGYPVTVRLLDLPLHEFLPRIEELIQEVTELKSIVKNRKRGYKKAMKILQEKERILKRALQLAEHNPMIGHRGCRLGISYPEIYRIQTRAILEAALELKKEGKEVFVEIMIPLVSEANELRILREIIKDEAEKVFQECGDRIEFLVGTMIETPRAALTASEIAKVADFFSFGTNDLTQMTFGFSRDDAEAKFMALYLGKKILPNNPFEIIDERGVGRLIKIATKEGKEANPKLKVGICGEHGGEPNSIRFSEEAGLDYVSCSPYRVPIARLAAAQATLKKLEVKITV